MAIQIQIRRDTIAQWTAVNPILAQGELGLDLNSGKIKVGNGIQAWNFLPYITSNLEVITANLQSQIDFIKNNSDSTDIDSLTEIMVNVNTQLALLSNVLPSSLENSGFNANLTSTGNFIVPGDLLPKTHLAQDLGSTTKAWRDLYISNATAHFGNAQLTITNNGLQVFNANNQPMPFIGPIKLPDGSLITSSSNIGNNTNLGNFDIIGSILQADAPVIQFNDQSMEIRTTLVGGGFRTWKYDQAGNLTVPGVIQGQLDGSAFTRSVIGYIPGTPVIILLDSDMSPVSATGRVTLSGFTPLTGAVQANGTYYYELISLNSFAIYSDAARAQPVSSINSWTAYEGSGGSATCFIDFPVVLKSGSNSWFFDNTGNLTLPSGGDILDINGVSVLSSTIGTTNTGNITFDDIIIQGVGNEYGGGGIYLSPDPSVTANLMYFRVRGGDSPTHLHLDTGNGSVYDQYFGDDGKYLKLGADGNISVGTSSRAWTFDTTGNLTLPQTVMNVSPAPTSLPGIRFTDGSLQTTAFTGSSAKIDIVNTNGLTTTYYPTFVEDRTNAQDMRADVDLTYRTDDNLLRSGNIQVGHNIYGSYLGGISTGMQFRPNIDIDKRFLFTVDSSGGTYLRSSMEMPSAEVDKAVTLVFPHTNSNAGFIYIQGSDSGATDFNDAFNIMMNSGNVKISALSYADGNKVWTFDTTGNLTLPQTVMNVSPAPTSLPGIRFTDGSLQTTAFTGTEFPTNIVNTHSGSAVIAVGSTQATTESLSVRVANVSSTLGVEVKYSHAVTASISAFRAYPDPANVYSGILIKSGSNTDWDNFGNLTTVGDSMSFTVSDHSNHKIYRVLITARAMPNSGYAIGDAYCVIEKLKL